MLKRNFDPDLPYLYACYGRMSSDAQNPRSPEQQYANIETTRNRLGRPWRHVKDYRDDAISGRVVQGRPGFQAMLRGIRNGAIQVDLILVDSWERFGRADELAAIRTELQTKFGVLVLTADSGFADPTSTAGKALGFVESIRSTEDSRLKAHNVRRGKIDAVLLKHWPGGPPRFGHRLELVMKTTDGRPEVDYSFPVPNPETAWILQHAYKRTVETHWGQDRLANDLNNDESIPDKFKPFLPSTVGRWMDKYSTIYYGDLTYDVHSTDIIDSHRVIERNPDADLIYVPEFCEPLISREIWEAVRELKESHRRRLNLVREQRGADNEKQIAPLCAGKALKYPLSGLVRCGDCGRVMIASGCGEYTTKDGEKKRYTAYACPVARAGICDNRVRVPESWLREQVIAKLRERLFPSSESGQWFEPLCNAVRAELARMDADRPTRAVDWEGELASLDERMKGWSVSLANPKLSSELRSSIENEWQQAFLRKQEIDTAVTLEDARHANADSALDPQQVVDRLARLSDVLARNNPTAVNHELSLYIAGIDCFADGRVVMRSVTLGAAPDAVKLLSQVTETKASEAPAVNGRSRKGKPRRRGPLATGLEDTAENRSSMHFAADPNRFADLGEEWFSVDEFQVPPPSQSWAEMNADVVFQRRQEAMLSYQKLAGEFEVTPPTIGAAIRHHLETHPGATDIKLRHGGRRKPRIDVAAFAAEARQLWEAGCSKLKLAKRFTCSPPTIDKALKLAYEADGQRMPTLQDRRRIKAAEARKLLDADHSLEQIAEAMHVSSNSVRAYLRASFRAEGKPMPDLRTRRSRK